MSMAPSGALTRSILARIAVTAPVISSTASPRTRSAIRNPPICAGVTSPDSIESNAAAASARVSCAPAATLAISGLNDSMAWGVPSVGAGGAERERHVEEISQDQATVLAGDALGVKLHAMGGTLAMRDRHDQTVVAFGGDFQFIR